MKSHRRVAKDCMTGGRGCGHLRRVALAVEGWAPSPGGARNGPRQERAYSNVVSRLPLFSLLRCLNNYDMTFFYRPPLRPIHRLATTKPLAAAFRPRTSVVNLLRNHLASKASNASPKDGLAPYPTSALEAARKLGTAIHDALYLIFVLIRIVYPQRLQIYNAPALEIATIGTFKLAGLFIFSMACLVVAPNVYADESSPVWMAPAGILAVIASVWSPANSS
jgi:hypothetical protein